MTRVFIVHGWGDKPGDHWMPWLRARLDEQGHSVVAPAMPSTDAPVIGPWVAQLNAAVGGADRDTYFVGHSVGCQTIMRHLEQTPAGTRVRGAVFVAPWFTLAGLSDEEQSVAKPWIETPIDYATVRERLPRLTAFFSTDDPWVSLENRDLLERRLGAHTHLLERRQHLGVESGMSTFPELLATVLSAVRE